MFCEGKNSGYSLNLYGDKVTTAKPTTTRLTTTKPPITHGPTDNYYKPTGGYKPTTTRPTTITTTRPTTTTIDDGTTPCLEKPGFPLKSCYKIRLFEHGKGDSVLVENSWECKKCWVLKFFLRTPASFDFQDFMDIEFAQTVMGAQIVVREVTSWSYPVASFERLSTKSYGYERWRIGFMPADLRHRDIFSF